MGVLCKLADAVFFIYFLLISIIAPLIDAQTCLPKHLFPPFLVELKNWYTNEYGDYLVSEKPHFFVGLVWLELLFQWPLAMACLYGIVARKSWLSTTCLMYGSVSLTSMVAILSEMKLSNRASERLLMMYLPFLGFSILALLRGLVTQSGKSGTIGNKPAGIRKKRA